MGWIGNKDLFPNDSSISRTDYLIGTDVSGATKTFQLDDLQSLLDSAGYTRAQIQTLISNSSLKINVNYKITDAGNSDETIIVRASSASTLFGVCYNISNTSELYTYDISNDELSVYGAFNPNDYATAAQGVKADTALQPSVFKTVLEPIFFDTAITFGDEENPIVDGDIDITIDDSSLPQTTVVVYYQATTKPNINVSGATFNLLTEDFIGTDPSTLNKMVFTYMGGTSGELSYLRPLSVAAEQVSFSDAGFVATDVKGALLELNENSGGASTYLELTDTPSTFTAKALQAANAGGTALENIGVFYDAATTRLGVNQSTPLAELDVKGQGTTSATSSFRATNQDGTRSLTFKDNGALDGVLGKTLFQLSGATTNDCEFVLQSMIPNSNTLRILNSTGTSIFRILAGSSGIIYSGSLRPETGVTSFAMVGAFNHTGATFNFGSPSSGNRLKDYANITLRAMPNATAGTYTGAAADTIMLFRADENYTGNAISYGNRQYWLKQNNVNIPATNSQTTIWNGIFLTAASHGDEVAFGLTMTSIGTQYDAGAGINGTDSIMAGYSGRSSIIGALFKNSGALSSTAWYAIKVDSGLVNMTLPTYADNVAALAGGLLANEIYKTATGELRIVI